MLCNELSRLRNLASANGIAGEAERSFAALGPIFMLGPTRPVRCGLNSITLT